MDRIWSRSRTRRGSGSASALLSIACEGARSFEPAFPDDALICARSRRFRYRHQHLILDRARRPWRTRRVNRNRRCSSARFRPPLEAGVSRLRGHLRCRLAGLSRTRRRARPDRSMAVRDARRCAHAARTVAMRWSACCGSPCSVARRIRGRERRRTPAPRSGDALDRRRQGGSERRAASPSQMGRFETRVAARRMRTSRLWPILSGAVDRPCAWPPAARGRSCSTWTSSVSPTHGEQEGSV